MRDRLFRVFEIENIRKLGNIRDSQVTAVRDKLAGWGDQLTVMTEEMRKAANLDHDVAPGAQTLDGMEVDEP